MNNLISGLYDLMEDRYGQDLLLRPDYQECQGVQRSLSAKLQAALGEEFCEKVNDITTEIAQMEREAAFTWGLRLGLALPDL